MPLYTAMGGSWLNMAESLQRIIVRRALAGQHPQSAQQVIDWLEQTVKGWNKNPTPFVWNGKRRRRHLGDRGPLSSKGIQLLADPLVDSQGCLFYISVEGTTSFRVYT
jgi:hypothetical protein